MLMEVTCRCGWITRGSKPEVIRNIQAHGLTQHELVVTPAEIRAVWRIVEDAPGAAHHRGKLR
ncbi:MAG: hypothetical protein ACREOM_11980 [Candidatus Dormibacteraceae bacterium]